MSDDEDYNDSLESLIRDAFNHLMTDVRVALPGCVDSVIDGATRLVNVRPMLSVRYYGRDEVVDLPVIQRVPLVEPRTSSAFISLPIKKGDPVLMIFSDRALENWIGSDGSIPVEPLDIRQHDITDAFAILGGWPEAMAGNRPGQNPDDLDIQVETGVKILIGNGADELLGLAHEAFTKLKEVAEELSTHLTDIQTMTMTAVEPGAGVSGPPLAADVTKFATSKTAVDAAVTVIDQEIENLGRLKK